MGRRLGAVDSASSRPNASAAELTCASWAYEPDSAFRTRRSYTLRRLRIFFVARFTYAPVVSEVAVVVVVLAAEAVEPVAHFTSACACPVSTEPLSCPSPRTCRAPRLWQSWDAPSRGTDAAPHFETATMLRFQCIPISRGRMKATPSTAMPTANVPSRTATAAPLITGTPGPRVVAIDDLTVPGYVATSIAHHFVADALARADQALTGHLR